MDSELAGFAFNAFTMESQPNFDKDSSSADDNYTAGGDLNEYVSQALPDGDDHGPGNHICILEAKKCNLENLLN